MTTLNRDDMRLAEDAAEWVVTMMLEPTPERRTDLVAWLQCSPRHVDEFLLAHATYRAFHAIDPGRQIDVNDLIADAKHCIVPLRPTVEPEGFPVETVHAAAALERRSLASRWAKAVGALALLVAIGVVWLYFDGANARIYTTRIGQQLTVRLSDGSLIELNARSRVKVDFSEASRQVHLLEGEALFVVAHDTARPFRVLTDAATIRAVGTQFNVYRSDLGTQVSVVEGRIQVVSDPDTLASVPRGAASLQRASPPISLPLTATVLAAGEQANVLAGKVMKVINPNVSNAIAWRQGRLVFDHMPLMDVVKEFNRYSDFRITLVGDQLLQRRISGMFVADNPQAIVSFLEGDKTVHVEHLDHGVLITLRAEEALL